MGPGAESSALPLPSPPGFTGYDAVQNRFSGQVGVNFKTLEAMGHSCSWPAPVTVRPSKDLNLFFNISMEMLANKQNTGKYSNIRDIYHIVDIVKYKEQQIKEQSMSIEKN